MVNSGKSYKGNFKLFVIILLKLVLENIFKTTNYIFS